MNEINLQSEKHLADFVMANPEKVRTAFALYPVFRKLERVGDMVTNIGENLIFYIDAKVLKHKKKKVEAFIAKAE